MNTAEKFTPNDGDLYTGDMVEPDFVRQQITDLVYNMSRDQIVKEFDISDYDSHRTICDFHIDNFSTDQLHAVADLGSKFTPTARFKSRFRYGSSALVQELSGTELITLITEAELARRRVNNQDVTSQEKAKSVDTDEEENLSI